MRMIDIGCNRTEFIESWLFEMPERVDDLEAFDTLLWSIQNRISDGEKPTQVKPGIYKLSGKPLLYWMGTPTKVFLAMELSQKPQSLVINLTGKHASLRGKPPYATDLYSAILNDNETSLIVSDTTLSDAGVNIWKTLVQQGYYVTVYNKDKPGHSRKTIKSPHELDTFLAKDNSDYRSWRFVLSKPGMQLWETVSFFNTRRYRELAGIENP
jgi:hypothetical protein